MQPGRCSYIHRSWSLHKQYSGWCYSNPAGCNECQCGIRFAERPSSRDYQIIFALQFPTGRDQHADDYSEKPDRLCLHRRVHYRYIACRSDDPFGSRDSAMQRNDKLYIQFGQLEWRNDPQWHRIITGKLHYHSDDHLFNSSKLHQ